MIPDPVSDREALDVSRRLTPAAIDRIMTAANGGDVEDLCRLCRELPEKSHDVAHALRARRNALLGCKWEIMPGNDQPCAKMAAEALKTALDNTGGDYGGEIGRLESFRRLPRLLSDALLPGFAAAEIVWKPGGVGFYGFRAVEQRFFTFAKSFSPRLRLRENWNGVELPHGKVIFHTMDENGPDPVRGGLIRPLAWLHCFSNLTLKDLLSFVERYGMPFVVAKIDDKARDKEGNLINSLIRTFGPNGGGIFSLNTELELLQAANNTGDVYFRLLEYVGDAVTKVILGQTASSGDSSGLSKGDAQSEVRQDILDADARSLEDTVNRDLFAVWTHYNYGPDVAAPQLVIQSEAGKDTAALATTIKTLYESGLQVADPDDVGERLGLRLERRSDPAAQPASPVADEEQPAAGEPGEADDAARNLNLKQKYDAMGVAIRAGLLTATPEIEEMVRKELRLPPVSEAVLKAWEATGGIRQPITLKSAEAEAVNDALKVEGDKKGDETALQLAEKNGLPEAGAVSSGVRAWFGPAAAELAELINSDLPAEEFERRLKAVCSGEKFGSSDEAEREMAEAAYDALAAGAVAADRRLTKKGGKHGLRGGK